MWYFELWPLNNRNRYITETNKDHDDIRAESFSALICTRYVQFCMFAQYLTPTPNMN